MFIIRPVEKRDLRNLLDLAKTAKVGITTLPADIQILEKKIKESILSFSKEVKNPQKENYLFVLEHLKDSSILGTCAIISQIGSQHPYHFYRLKSHTHYCKALNQESQNVWLHPHSKHSGPSEICTLYLHPQWRKTTCGRLLSLSRFLFIHAYPKRFKHEIIAEMRGVCHENGHSPFWDAVGKHFFHMEFKKADYLWNLHKGFIQDLLPSIPLCREMLPKDAQKVISCPHPNTLPAYYFLMQEGFTVSQDIDIFDAGPKLLAKTEHIRTIKECKRVKLTETVDNIQGEEEQLLANEKIHFRASYGRVKQISPRKAILEKDVASSLNLKIGESFLFVRPRGKKKHGK